MADDYKVYGNLQVTKDDIAIRRLEAINLKNDMMTKYLMNNARWRTSYQQFRTSFNGLYDASLYFISRTQKANIEPKKLKEIRDLLHISGVPITPLSLERAFDGYLEALGRSGLVDFGYEEKSFVDKMRART